jgi:hypothetical protein
MKMVLLLLPVWVVASQGQIATPTTPAKFAKRDVASGAGANSPSVDAKLVSTESSARITSHYSFGESRQWKSTDGRSLVGKMIAFEDAVIEVKRPTAAEARAAAMSAPAPKPPEKFTLVREGKIRLLVNDKPYEVALERLSKDDRSFVNQVEDAVNRK